MKVLIVLLYSTMALLLSCGAPYGVREITSTEEMQSLLASDRYYVVDVRTPEEFDQGHIAGAINIPVGNSQFVAEIASLQDNKGVIVYCRSGNRSTMACQKLRELKLDSLINYKGGMQQWQDGERSLKRK